eukprot:14442220-Alexandrium_andersonii.AAC.1
MTLPANTPATTTMLILTMRVATFVIPIKILAIMMRLAWCLLPQVVIMQRAGATLPVGRKV